MPSYATASVTGHMTQPEQRYSAQGTMIASFSLPVNDRELKNGEWVEAPTTWWRCTAFGKLAERVIAYDKGTLLTVIGRAKLRPWTAQDGSERQSLEVVVSELQFLARPRDVSGTDFKPQPAAQPEVKRDVNDLDLPF